MPKSPMLAERESAHLYPDDVRFPLYALPKLDGIRCVIEGGIANSRKFIPIKNNHIRELLSNTELEGLDGELTVGPVNAENVFNLTTSAVMGNRVIEPQFEYHVFDDFSTPDDPWHLRQDRLRERLDGLTDFFPMLRYVQPTHISNWNALDGYEQIQLAAGYEGVITRDPNAPYKFGRSSRNQQGMLKLKRFADSEAEVIGFVELMHNTNEDVKDALGHAKRSKAQAGLVGGATLGKLQCRDLKTGVEFQIGMFKGLTMEDKQAIWDDRERYLGKYVKYGYFSHGVVDLPRHSKFLGWRDPADM